MYVCRENSLKLKQSKTGWEIIDKIQGRFCKNVIRSSNDTAKGTAEWERSGEDRKGKMISIIVKYWDRILLMEKDEFLKCYYEWQVGNPKCDSWASILCDEL
jgi:hypothetical protein